MKRVDQIITQVRKQTDNEDVSATTGISTEEFVQFLNDAQFRLQSRLLDSIPDLTIFDTSKTVSTVANTRGYSIASSTAEPVLGNSVRLVEFRVGSLEDDYYQLEPAVLDDLSTVAADYPSTYDIRDGQILISPIPSSSIGTLRITFPRRLDTIDIRRGKIQTVNQSGGNYTSFVLYSDPVPDNILDDDDFYICVNDKYGTVNYYNIPISSYDTSTRTLTVDGTVAVSGGTITAGDWVTYGKFTTTHPKLPTECERYLIAYAKMEIFARDSNDSDGLAQQQKLTAIENELISTYRDMKRQRETMSITNDLYVV